MGVLLSFRTAVVVVPDKSRGVARSVRVSVPDGFDWHDRARVVACVHVALTMVATDEEGA